MENLRRFLVQGLIFLKLISLVVHSSPNFTVSDNGNDLLVALNSNMAYIDAPPSLQLVKKRTIFDARKKPIFHFFNFEEIDNFISAGGDVLLRCIIGCSLRTVDCFSKPPPPIA